MILETYQLEDASSIISPALIYYQEIIEENIDKMIRIAGGTHRLWPHVKTHKSIDMIHLLIERGINRFKCATMAEGEMLGLAGAKQVIVAYPLIGPNIKRFIKLMDTFPNTEFFAIGDDEGQIKRLSASALEVDVSVQFLLDINCGMNRTGVAGTSAGRLYRVAAHLPAIVVRGMHVYDGHRHETAMNERRKSADDDVLEAFQLRDTLQSEGIDCSIMVLGGTPSFPCHAENEQAFLSPGTCMIHDAGHAASYMDLPFEIGAMVLTRVVSHPAPGVFTVDLGTKGVAADPAIPRAVIIGYEKAQTVLQSEEHWVLRMPEGREDDRPAIGQELYAAPWHICPTSALYPNLLVARNHRVETEWPVTARNRKITI